MAAIGSIDEDIQNRIIQMTSLMPLLNVEQINISPDYESRKDGVDVVVDIPASVTIVVPLLGMPVGSNYSLPAANAIMRHESAEDYTVIGEDAIVVDLFTLTQEGENMKVLLGISDVDGVPIQGASVTVNIYKKQGQSDVFWNGFTGALTNEDGTITKYFTLDSGTGFYRGKVVDIQAQGFTWYGIAPEPTLSVQPGGN